MENFLEEYSKFLDESKEHLSYQAIATYLNLKELLSSKEKSFIENHIKGCSVCKEKFDTVYNEDLELDNELSETDSIADKNIKQDEVKIPNYWRYAAAIILIAATAVIYFYFGSKEDSFITQDFQDKDSVIVSEDKKDDLAEKDSVHPTVPEELIAEDLSLGENFRDNRILENFINRNVRSESNMKIVSPVIADTVNEPITFKWQKPDISSIVNLILVDNKNKPLYEKNVAGNEITYGGKLQPGLYYWKIESNGKLEVGKFYIK